MADGGAVQRDRALTRPGLGRPHGDGVTECDALLVDHHHPLVEVDVDPAQPGRLTPAQAA